MHLESKCLGKKAVQILKENMDAPIDKIIEFTDGCAAQYKGKHAFYDISELSVQKFPTVQRNFFETSHGQSVCDELGAVIKRSCYQEVVSGKRIIKDAKDLFDFVKQKLTLPLKVI